MDRVKLQKAWQDVCTDGMPVGQNIFVSDDSIDASNSVTGATHFTRNDAFWRDLICNLKASFPDEKLEVCITGMSVGCEVYDAARIALDKGVDLRFYGHDISSAFTVTL